MIDIKCTSCGQTLSVPDSQLGELDECPGCHAVMMVVTPPRGSIIGVLKGLGILNGVAGIVIVLSDAIPPLDTAIIFAACIGSGLACFTMVYVLRLLERIAVASEDNLQITRNIARSLTSALHSRSERSET